MEEQEKKTPPLSKKSVLVVEDNKDIQAAIKLALESEGYNVLTADNGKEAFEQLNQNPTPCLILLDLMMPVMNGWEFSEKISHDLILSNIPIVVVTAFGDKKATPKSEALIQKPIDLDALLSTVGKHCS